MTKGIGTGMLGVGGQRRHLSRQDLRGGTGDTTPPADDAMAARRELIRRLKSRKGRRR
ncbi:hypothetical protein LX16_0356 [Stackebrandtia albiflava]|uniref:Uncharacterized protein n=1 Tax=Stackebrandtia albiflava TaxID=406432 RepID=A0A562V9V7_9ACTN|nr:DUF6243 family protein [Stackebrandtia albiflava]TWJ14669.1 hypothetical protein LX16_0356 [Stackebrandtia albiflava]